MILFLLMTVVYAEEFKLYIGLTQPITPIISGENNGVVFMSVDILSKLNLPFKSAGANIIELDNSNKKLHIYQYMGMPCISIYELADKLEIEYRRENNNVRIYNKVVSVLAENGFVNIEFAFASAYEYYFKKNNLVIDLMGFSYNPSAMVRNMDHENVNDILIGQETLDAIRCMCLLKNPVSDTKAKKGQGSFLNLKLGTFTGKAPGLVKEIKAYSQGQTCYLCVKGGTAYNYSVDEDMETGKIGIYFRGNVFDKSLPKIYHGGLLDFQLKGNVISCQVSRIQGIGISEKAGDLIFEFAPARGTGLNLNHLKVCIDPGHGDKDAGATYGKLYEKDINHKAAMFLKEELERRGVNTVVTRDENGFLSLSDRGQLAIDNDCHIFISLHTNSTVGENKVSGVETYYRGNMFSAEYLGLNIHNEIVKFIPIPDKKLKKDTVLYKTGLGVLRKCNSGGVPGILVEMGFINHATDRKYLTDDEYLANMAKAIADGIEKYATGKPLNKLK